MRVAALLAAIAFLTAPVPSFPQDLVSPGYRHRGGVFNSIAGDFGAAQGATFFWGESRSTLGQGLPVTFSGGPDDLTVNAAGFWPIVAGGFPSLDADTDGIAAFLDSDDDGDGLGDEVESGTGYFVSLTNTGTDPQIADTDGDGFDDGEEVALAADPNDAGSTPDSTAPVPALFLPTSIALCVLLVLAGCIAQRKWRLDRERFCYQRKGGI